MSRARYCMTTDRDGFIEELAAELWEERHGAEANWAEADPRVQLEYRKRAAETLRVLEHGHG